MRTRWNAWAIGLVVLVQSGCLFAPVSAPEAKGWPIEILTPPAGTEPLHFAQRPHDEGYRLHFRTSVAGLVYTDTASFIDSLSKQSNGKATDGVGHSWIRLESPARSIELGHSGEYGKSQPTYNSGVMSLMRRGDPNPARYLWEEMQDGIRLKGSGGRRRTFACHVPITREQFHSIDAFVASYDFKVFALREKGCTDFVVRAARLADVTLPNRVRVRLPARIEVMGSMRTLWTDPEYGSIVFGSPEVLESGLRKLVAAGIARN